MRPLQLPPPPTYGCKPQHSWREDDPESGPGGPRCNPAAALLRRQEAAKRPLERKSTSRERKEVVRQRYRQLRREGGPGKKKQR